MADNDVSEIRDKSSFGAFMLTGVLILDGHCHPRGSRGRLFLHERRGGKSLVWFLCRLCRGEGLDTEADARGTEVVDYAPDRQQRQADDGFQSAGC